MLLLFVSSSALTSHIFPDDATGISAADVEILDAVVATIRQNLE